MKKWTEYVNIKVSNRYGWNTLYENLSLWCNDPAEKVSIRLI